MSVDGAPAPARPKAELLASALSWLQRPFAVAREQPPAPGSYWANRGWSAALRVGGKFLGLLPRDTSTPMLVLRLVVTAVLWVVVVAVAIEVIAIYVIIVLPFQLLARWRRSAAQPTPQVTASPASYPPPAWTLPAGDAPASRDVLDSLPDPGHAPALTNCAMCGGSTSGATGDCLFCGTPLSMIPSRGWHLDPLRQGSRRWYDGTRWTPHFEHAP